MVAVFKREFKAYFTSAIGYVTLLVLFFITGVLFSQMYASGYPYIDYLFSNSAIIAAFIIPIIVVVALLAMQALCDLELPSYTSDIINNGIL